MRARAALAIGGALSLLGLAAAQAVGPDFPPVLARAIRSAGKARYSGERVVEFKRGAERTRLVEYVLRDGPRLRIDFPEDSPYRGQIIVEDGRRRLHFHPDRNEIRVMPARGEETVRRLRGLMHHTKRRGLVFSVIEGGKVAGVSTQAIVVSDPRGNVVQRLWVEPRAGVILKRELYDPVGARMGFFEFRRIDLTPRFAPGDFQINRRGAVVVMPDEEARRLASQLGLSQVVLPGSTGFRLEHARIIRPRGEEILARFYTGAKGRLTLFQTKAAISEERLQRMARGRLSTHTWSRGGEQFALVGELPAPRLREIAHIIGDA